MLKKCFIDSVCWIALLNKDDELHSLSDIKYKQLFNEGYHFFTTSTVITEVANSLSKPKFRSSVIEYYKMLKISKRVKTIFVDSDLWHAGWDLYQKRLDKAWSLTDCISIVVMQKENIIESLTNDIHFKQAGFQINLKKGSSAF